MHFNINHQLDKNNKTDKVCIWCLKKYPEVTFNKIAHTIPKSLGGQNYNRNVCDSCNEYFGTRNNHNNSYSIEEALKETFIISRQRFMPEKTKRKTGRFKSKFFEVKQRNGKYRLKIKQSFKFTRGFQEELCRAFKRGLYKMVLEELDRQNKGNGHSRRFDMIRDFARYNKADLPVYYFERKVGVYLIFRREAETPKLHFDRMKYLASNDEFLEIEFLGHVFGFPITKYTNTDLTAYLTKSSQAKARFFHGPVIIRKLTDIDFSLNVMNN